MADITYKTVYSEFVDKTWTHFEFEEEGFLTYSEPLDDVDNRPRYLLVESELDVPDGTKVGIPLTRNLDNRIPKGQHVFFKSGQGKSLISISIQNT